MRQAVLLAVLIDCCLYGSRSAAAGAAVQRGGGGGGGVVPAVERMGSVDLGILAETTPVVWKEELWLLECIQGGRYYDNINFASYPNEPQPPGYLRFTNPVSGERSKPFARGYGLGNALVVDGRMFVFATSTPFGISSNNTVVTAFWSDDLITWESSAALTVGPHQPNMFPPTVTSKKLFNTCVRPHAGDDSAVTS